MPTKIRILNGPGFRDIYTYGPLTSTGSNYLRFTVGRWLPKGEVPPADEKPREIVGPIVGIIMNTADARNVKTNLAHEQNQIFSVILKHTSRQNLSFFVFRFDLATHSGEGMEFTEEGFYGSSYGSPVNAVTSIMLGHYKDTAIHLGFDYEKESVDSSCPVIA